MRSSDRGVPNTANHEQSDRAAPHLEMAGTASELLSPETNVLAGECGQNAS